MVLAWLSLQNIEGAAFEAMCAYLAARPKPFLDIAELSDVEFGPVARRKSLEDLMVSMRDHPIVNSALSERLPLWLGRWSRQAQILFRDEHHKDWQIQRTSRIELNLGAMSPEERHLFESVTTETPEPSDIRLDHIAALVLASRPLASNVRALLGWSMVQVVARDYLNAFEELSWIVRLNREDWDDTKAAALSLIPRVNVNSSEPMRDSAALLLRLLGDKPSSVTAAELSPLPPKGRKHRRVEVFCDTNPHDPDALEGSNFAKALDTAVKIGPSQICIGRGVTEDDLNLQDITPALARFQPQAIVDLLRAVASTTPNRNELELRMISMQLFKMSPILDASSLAEVRRGLESLIINPERIASKDSQWVITWLTRSITPHLCSEQQLDLLLSMPAGLPLSYSLMRGLSPLHPESLSSRMQNALANNNEELKRILFFVSASKHELNQYSREIILNAIFGDDKTTAICAAHASHVADDAKLDQLLLDKVRETSIMVDATTEKGFAIGKAVAVAVVRHTRLDMISLVPSEFMGLLANQLGGVAVDRFASYIESVFKRFLAPVSAQSPNNVNFVIETSRDELMVTRSAEDAGEKLDNNDIHSLMQTINEQANFPNRIVERQNVLIAAAEKFTNDLRLEDAQLMATKPPLQGFTSLVSKYPDRAGNWLTTILATEDPQKLSQVRNLGIVLAGAYATRDPEMTRQILHLLKDIEPWPPTNIIVDDTEVPLYQYVLFSSAPAPELEALRRLEFEDAFDDASIERATVGAQSFGAGDWLSGYVQELIGSEHPGEQARSLTIAGLLRPNPESERILSTDWGDGFLGDVAEQAKRNYQRAGWARTWLEKAGASDNGIDFWRFCILAQGVADLRALADFDELAINSAVFNRFGAQAREGIKNAAKKRNEKRKETFFGQKKPEQAIITMLRDILSGRSF